MNFREIFKLIKCKHSHTIVSHPACFASGEVIDRRVDQTIPWYNLEGLKIGYLDIEADNLKADFGTLLTWCIKERDGEISYDMVTKEELFDGQTDRRIVASLLNELSKYAIVITYYGGDYHFDIPYVRSKALHYKIPFPAYRSIYAYDLYNTVKSKLKLSRNSLEAVCDYLGIEGKTLIDREIWRRAKYGDRDALDSVLDHNEHDVIILEELHKRIEPFRGWYKSSI